MYIAKRPDIWYTADNHFHSGKKNLFYRPFETVEEMDSTMLENIVNTVRSGDTLFFCGDVGAVMCPPIDILKKIRCHKILIVGNNDDKYRGKVKQDFMDCFDKVWYGYRMVYDHNVDKRIMLSHFPLASWEGSRDGVPQFYGHLHSRKDDGYEQMTQIPNVYNIGVDVRDYFPKSAAQIFEEGKR